MRHVRSLVTLGIAVAAPAALGRTADRIGSKMPLHRHLAAVAERSGGRARWDISLVRVPETFRK